MRKYILSRTVLIEEEEIFDIGDKVCVVSKKGKSVVGHIVDITEDKVYIKTPETMVSIYTDRIEEACKL